MKQRIIFFGSSKYVIPIIQTLKSTKSRFNLEFVVTTDNSPIDPVPSYCLKNKIPYISVSNLSGQTLNSQLSISNYEIAVLAYFGIIIPKDVLNLFPRGIINVHPSLLPKYRGPTPAQTAILNGDKITGVTLIKLDNEIDHGPIIAQREEPILLNDTADSLYNRLFKIGAELLEQNINQYLKQQIKASKQSHSKASFTKRLTREDGRIDIARLKTQSSKLEIARKIRAYYPWPGVWFETKLNSQKRLIKLLPNEKIQIDGGKQMNYKDFINGYKEGKEILSKLKLI